jgi:hypothetical protein
VSGSPAEQPEVEAQGFRIPRPNEHSEDDKARTTAKQPEVEGHGHYANG